MIDKQKGLEKLARCVEMRKRFLEDIDQTVRMLRTPGLDGHCEATWQEIATALGVSPQAVQAKWKDLSWQGGDADSTQVVSKDS